jgi:hypothetical protein
MELGFVSGIPDENAKSRRVMAWPYSSTSERALGNDMQFPALKYVNS